MLGLGEGAVLVLVLVLVVLVLVLVVLVPVMVGMEPPAMLAIVVMKVFLVGVRGVLLGVGFRFRFRSRSRSTIGLGPDLTCNQSALRPRIPLPRVRDIDLTDGSRMDSEY